MKSQDFVPCFLLKTFFSPKTINFICLLFHMLQGLIGPQFFGWGGLVLVLVPRILLPHENGFIKPLLFGVLINSLDQLHMPRGRVQRRVVKVLAGVEHPTSFSWIVSQVRAGQSSCWTGLRSLEREKLVSRVFSMGKNIFLGSTLLRGFQRLFCPGMSMVFSWVLWRTWSPNLEKFMMRSY